jgi:hypothetical protein
MPTVQDPAFGAVPAVNPGSQLSVSTKPDSPAELADPIREPASNPPPGALIYVVAGGDHRAAAVESGDGHSHERTLVASQRHANRACRFVPDRNRWIGADRNHDIALAVAADCHPCQLPYNPLAEARDAAGDPPWPHRAIGTGRDHNVAVAVCGCTYRRSGAGAGRCRRGGPGTPKVFCFRHRPRWSVGSEPCNAFPVDVGRSSR